MFWVSLPSLKANGVFYASQLETTIKLVWAILVYLLKFSTLALLREIFFSCSKAVRVTIRILTYASIICASASITATLYIDSPTERWCDLTNPPLDMRKMNKVNGIFNMVTTVVLDFAIFCVPIWQLVSVRIKGRKKTLVMASFALGFTWVALFLFSWGSFNFDRPICGYLALVDCGSKDLLNIDAASGPTLTGLGRL